MSLNEEQKKVVDKVLEGRNVLITGSAGTGKSFLINHICGELTAKNKLHYILAPTGVAALNVSGQTIHRFLGLRPDVQTIQDYRKLCARRSKVAWKDLKVIIIDEVSMVHPNLFQLFSEIAKLHRDSSTPFGGIQMILIGDYFQLSPIPEKSDVPNAPLYIFETDLFQDMGLETHVLTKVMRQEDAAFINSLNDLRVGKYSKRVAELVKDCALNKKEPGKHYVKLFALNIDKNQANDTALAKLPGVSTIFTSIDTGDVKYLQGCRAEKILELKVGCPVMFLWNEPEQDLCNGSVGVVEDFKNGLPIVFFNNGVKIAVERRKYVIPDAGKSKPLAARLQLPLALAWSISAHKCQSISLDHVEADCRNIFTTGQLYVMLSRARTKEGLIIKNFSESAIKVDKKVIEFYNIR